MPFESGLDEQAGAGLAARTMIGLVMRANHDVVDGKTAADDVVHPIEFAAGLVATGQARLVRGHNEDKSRLLELGQGVFGILLDLELLQGEGRHLVLRSGPNFVQYTVPFNEHSSLHTWSDLSKSLVLIIGNRPEFRSSVPVSE